MTFIKKSYNSLQGFFNSPGVKNIIDSKRFVFVCSGLLAAVFFMWVYGVRVLNPFYIDWLIVPNVTDRTQHFLGWEAFRSFGWGFPPGMFSSLTYPFYESIMYSDSIPLLAIPFKALSSVLPQNFQYFGLFGFALYILQGGFGGLIIKKISACSGLAVLCSLFFSTSVFMAYRMFSHTALSAHFLILAAIYTCLTKDYNRSTKRSCVIWGSLLGIAAALHMYLFVMIFGFICFYILDDLFEYKKIIKSLIEFCVPVAFAVFILFIIGAFHSNAQNSIGGLGNHSTNINQFINSEAVYADIGAEYADFSSFLGPLPLISSGQSEGNVYIGLGMMLFFFVAVYAFISDFKAYKQALANKKTLRRVILTVLLFLGFYVFALSPTVTFGEKILFNYRPLLPGRIIILWDIFRATGRFIWPCAYIIMITLIWAAVKKLRHLTLMIIVILLLVVQVVDLSGYHRSMGEVFRVKQTYESSLKSELWDVISRDYDHIFYTGGPVNRDHVSFFAARNKMTVNDTYLARKDVTAIETLKGITLDELHNGYARTDTVYVFETLPVQLFIENVLAVYIVDGMILGVANEIEGAAGMVGVVHATAYD